MAQKHALTAKSAQVRQGKRVKYKKPRESVTRTAAGILRRRKLTCLVVYQKVRESQMKSGFFWRNNSCAAQRHGKTGLGECVLPNRGARRGGPRPYYRARILWRCLDFDVEWADLVKKAGSLMQSGSPLPFAEADKIFS